MKVRFKLVIEMVWVFTLILMEHIIRETLKLNILKEFIKNLMALKFAILMDNLINTDNWMVSVKCQIKQESFKELF